MNKTTTIARREYYVLGTSIKYALEILAPHMPKDANGSWHCEVRIVGENVPDGLKSIEVGGDDSYQSLLLALKVAKAQMESLNKHLGSKLRLYEDSITDLYLE